MTEKNNGNNKSEIKWAEDTEKEHPATALDESAVLLHPDKTTLCQMTTDSRDRESDKKLQHQAKLLQNTLSITRKPQNTYSHLGTNLARNLNRTSDEDIVSL